MALPVAQVLRVATQDGMLRRLWHADQAVRCLLAKTNNTFAAAQADIRVLNMRDRPAFVPSFGPYEYRYDPIVAAAEHAAREAAFSAAFEVAAAVDWSTPAALPAAVERIYTAAACAARRADPNSVGAAAYDGAIRAVYDAIVASRLLVDTAALAAAETECADARRAYDRAMRIETDARMAARPVWTEADHKAAAAAAEARRAAEVAEADKLHVKEAQSAEASAKQAAEVAKRAAASARADDYSGGDITRIRGAAHESSSAYFDALDAVKRAEDAAGLVTGADAALAAREALRRARDARTAAERASRICGFILQKHTAP